MLPSTQEPSQPTSGPSRVRSEQSQPPAAAPPPVGAPRTRRRIVLVALAIILAAGVYGIWRGFFAKPSVPDNIVALSGRIEGDDSAIAPKTTGRILEIRFREGDSVKAGDIIAILSDDQIAAREEQPRAAVSVAEAKSKAARDQIAVLEQQLQQNQLQTSQSGMDAQGRMRQAEAELAAAEAAVAQQEASLQIASFDRDAYTRLAQTGAASE